MQQRLSGERWLGFAGIRRRRQIGTDLDRNSTTEAANRHCLAGVRRRRRTVTDLDLQEFGGGGEQSLTWTGIRRRKRRIGTVLKNLRRGSVLSLERCGDQQHRRRACPEFVADRAKVLLLAWLGKSPTCRRHVSPTAKSRHFWPTLPSRADTNSFPTLFFVSGIADFLQIFSSNHRTNW